jgi:hypothetical protein
MVSGGIWILIDFYKCLDLAILVDYVIKGLIYPKNKIYVDFKIFETLLKGLDF